MDFVAVNVPGPDNFEDSGYLFTKVPSGFKVVSPKGNNYLCKLLKKGWTCDCPGYKHNGVCKHVNALPKVDKPVRHPREVVEPTIDKIKEVLSKYGEFEIVGSYRRGKKDVKDVDVLIAIDPEQFKQMGQDLTAMGLEQDIAGADIYRGYIQDPRIEVDISRVNRDEYATYLLYRTGSSDFNVGMRIFIKSIGGRINEHGLWLRGKKIPTPTEESIFEALGLPYVPPEKREDWPFGDPQRMEFPTLWVKIIGNDRTPKSFVPILKRGLGGGERYSFNENRKGQDVTVSVRVVTSDDKDFDELRKHVEKQLEPYQRSDKIVEFRIAEDRKMTASVVDEIRRVAVVIKALGKNN